MIDTNTIENVFQYFYIKKYGNKKTPSKTETTKNYCKTFIGLLDKQYSINGIGKTFLWEYFLFQFDYWDGLTLNGNHSDKISLSYIIGKKAFLRYVDRNRDYDWLTENYKIINKLGLSKSDIDKYFEPVKYNMVDRSNELRKMYYNTDRGFATCIEFTSLFVPSCTLCILCNYKAECKELQRVNY